MNSAPVPVQALFRLPVSDSSGSGPSLKLQGTRRFASASSSRNRSPDRRLAAASSFVMNFGQNEILCDAHETNMEQPPLDQLVWASQGATPRAQSKDIQGSWWTLPSDLEILCRPDPQISTPKILFRTHRVPQTWTASTPLLNNAGQHAVTHASESSRPEAETAHSVGKFGIGVHKDEASSA